MLILDRSGHTTMEWTSETVEGEDTLSQEYVEAEFNRLVAQGHLAFAEVEVAPGKKENHRIKTFDPATHGKVIMVPQFVGG